MSKQILTAFKINTDEMDVISFGSGLINYTWKVASPEGEFILQRINNEIFKKPEDIAFNIDAISHYFVMKHPNYYFVAPQKTVLNESMLHLANNGYFRLFRFVPHSHTIDVVSTTKQAFEAAKQFGRFTFLLSSFTEEDLRITLPDFHNLTLRYYQFEAAIANGNIKRIEKSMAVIQFLSEQKNIVFDYEVICSSTHFKKRATHHDTKISNVLLDESDNGICVIDLDTVMPGYFISDVGDMFRTYLSPVSEEENDFSKIEIRTEYFKAIAKGYLGEMKNELSEEEINHFVYAGKFMIYMQALRFLTDYLNDDVYYGAKYKEHNFVRANNQIVLLQKFMEKEEAFKLIVNEITNEVVSAKM
jgi:Ser/Thr protein kinase RdoA (MazF antagonist)